MIAPYHPSRAPWARLKRRAVLAYAPHTRTLSRKRGAVSFTFDDAPRSAITHGAAILDAFGVKGTFYLCAHLTSAETHLGAMHTWADVEALLAAGHEIACHTASHGDCARQSLAEVNVDLDANTRAFAAMGAPALHHFAYPFGETSFALKRTITKRFCSARGITGGLNCGAMDMAQLRAQRLYGEATFAAVSRLLHKARDQRGWAILFTHDVQDQPSAFGCTPELLKRTIALAQTLDLDVAPVRDVLSELELRP